MEHIFPANESSVMEITEYFSKKLKEYKISDKLCREYELLIEELVTKIIYSADTGADISFEIKKRFDGTISAKLTCPGKPVVLESESSTDFSGQIIGEYVESLRQSYSFGVNEIVFSTSFSSNEILLKNTISFSAAIVLGLIFCLLFKTSQLNWISDNALLPIVHIFIRCMQTVAVPVSFFSLAVFVVVIRRTFDRDNKTVHLTGHYVISSLISMLIGVLVWFIFRNLAPKCDFSTYRIIEDNFIGSTLKDFLIQVVSTNIIEPFIISNPIPFLVNGLLTGFAASSVFGKSGDTIRKILTSVNDLFSRMMNIIYGTIPFFLFVAVFDLVISKDFRIYKVLIFNIICVFVSILLLVLYYLLRLVFGRINLKEFFKDYSKLLLENFKIASNIDSYPYNRRVLSRKMSLSRDYLSEGLKLGILLNMDGNCVVISVVLFNLITAVGVGVSPMKYIGIVIILILFSVGSPNNPGSFLLGMIILMSFVGISSELVGLVLVMETIISKFYSFLNAAGDIVTLAIEDEKNKRKAA